MATPINVAGYRPFVSLELARSNLRPPGVMRPQSDAAKDPFPSRSFGEVDLEVDPSDRTCWCWMAPTDAPSFTPSLLADLAKYTAAIHESFLAAGAEAQPPIKHSVLASRLPGVFNLGGDLGCFLRWIELGDREALTAYAYACINVLHDNAIGFGHDIITIALIQGDALGGGFETALSCHMIVAEKGVKFGLPEILFNLFPGMGALSLLTRKVGLAQAERMVTSGSIYTAEDLYALGVVTVLAETGQGIAETHRLIQRNLRRRNSLTAMRRASQRVMPLPYSELRDVTDIWVEAALALEPGDLRKMQRLTTAQDRRMALHDVAKTMADAATNGSAA